MPPLAWARLLMPELEALGVGEAVEVPDGWTADVAVGVADVVGAGAGR